MNDAEKLHVRAEMARRGVTRNHLDPYWSPDNGDVNPLDDPEVQNEVRSFMGWLWKEMS